MNVPTLPLLKEEFGDYVCVEAVSDDWPGAPKRVRFNFPSSHTWLFPDEARELGDALIAAAAELEAT